MQDERCEYCHGEIHAKKVTVYHRHKGQLVVIENVPAGVCRRCGERYYDAATVETMETMAQLKSTAKHTVVVPIRDFAEIVAS